MISCGRIMGNLRAWPRNTEAAWLQTLMGAGPLRLAMKRIRVVMAIALLAALIGCGPERTKGVPPELVGVWRTTATKYADADCFLGLTTATISFGTGGDDSYTRAVVAVEKSQEDGGTLYTVFYRDDEGEYKFAFFYEPADGGVIRYKNQKGIVWTKQKGGVTHQLDEEAVRVISEARAAVSEYR
jgi:hypothetical protein